MPNNQQNDQVARLERRHRVGQLYVKGLTQQQIARELGIAQSVVCGDLKKIRADWLACSLQNFDQRKSEELARLDAVERQAWVGWERSCQNAETLHVRTERKPRKVQGNQPANQPADPEERTISEKTVKGQSGDPAFLETVRKTIESRCKILGLVKPGDTNVNVTTLSWDDLWRGAAKEGPLPEAVTNPEEAERAALSAKLSSLEARLNGGPHP